MTLRRYDLTKTIVGDWSLKEERALRAIRRFTTKEHAFEGDALEKLFGRKGACVRVYNEDGTIQEQRTYPASDDSLSRGPSSIPGRRREEWKDEDNATLRRMAGAGEPLLMIARALGRTQEAVSTRARRLGVSISR